jgi:hypothetical protein
MPLPDRPDLTHVAPEASAEAHRPHQSLVQVPVWVRNWAETCRKVWHPALAERVHPLENASWQARPALRAQLSGFTGWIRKVFICLRKSGDHLP